jgi:hypothetical protein
MEVAGLEATCKDAETRARRADRPTAAQALLGQASSNKAEVFQQRADKMNQQLAALRGNQPENVNRPTRVEIASASL